MTNSSQLSSSFCIDICREVIVDGDDPDQLIFPSASYYDSAGELPLYS